MALNPFFLQGSYNEQFLVQDLINEQLKIFGIEVYYLPRKIFKTDDIIREVQSSKFDDSFLIEAYLNNYEGYNPGSDIMTKFGLQLKNEISLTISRERFEEFITPFMEAISTGLNDGKVRDFTFEDLVSRPREGDLIYFPLGERLFEIKRVESEKPFYQLGRNYIYELSCELYEYENELIETSVDEVDNTVEDDGYNTSLILVGSAITAVAEAVVGSAGMIGEIHLNNDGHGYNEVPTISIDPPLALVGAKQAKAVAITTSILNVNSIKSIRIIDPGSGYDPLNPPNITIIAKEGDGGAGAAATASIVDNGISKIAFTNNGTGYFTNPSISIDSPSSGLGNTAIVEPVISEGSFQSVRFLNAGSGYTETPSVSIVGISSVGIGTFVYNEIVRGESSGVEARVKDYRNITAPTPGIPSQLTLKIALNTGKFVSGEVVVGTISSARYYVSSHDLESFDNQYDTNEELELEADNILDFTESNPFGDY